MPPAAPGRAPSGRSGPGRLGPRPGAGPALLRAPAVTGAGRVGQPLAADPGAWSGEPAPRLALQWQRGGADIAGARDRHFIPGPAEAATPLRLRVTAENGRGAAEAVSNEIFVHAAEPADPGLPPDPPFDISGVPDLTSSPDFTGRRCCASASPAPASASTRRPAPSASPPTGCSRGWR